MTKQLIWIFPDRGSYQQTKSEHKYFWSEYAAVADDLNMFMQVVSPERIDVVYSPGQPAQVYVNGQCVLPEETIFITELYTFPYQQQDVPAQLFLYSVLEQLGFYLPISPQMSRIMNDKMATFALFHPVDVPILPCVRLTPGRDLDERDWPDLLANFTFPLVVKPASWGGGLGINRVRDMSELRNILGLARGSEVTMLLQPQLIPQEGAQTIVDYRVYCVNQEPHTVLVRAPVAGELVGNATRGGHTGLVEMPAALEPLVARALSVIEAPYVCIDFLYDGEQFWLSEIEMDGAISAAYIDDQDGVYNLLKSRFLAYASAHDAWLQHPEPAP